MQRYTTIARPALKAVKLFRKISASSTDGVSHVSVEVIVTSSDGEGRQMEKGHARGYERDVYLVQSQN